MCGVKMGKWMNCSEHDGDEMGKYQENGKGDD
jgi:hypothetical protein